MLNIFSAQPIFLWVPTPGTIQFCPGGSAKYVTRCQCSAELQNDEWHYWHILIDEITHQRQQKRQNKFIT